MNRFNRILNANLSYPGMPNAWDEAYRGDYIDDPLDDPDSAS